ncbi:universal stress protein [Mucilaginibacter phyllosphaerae]|uniref:Nucleotide-binding universal stress UspA family protein n=1 Tax=Mucilaginibacter phyllosphaerae TaxID=1812349 RepID=A0A4Y8A8A5_9SPHI|nr:universal stress protein [Mucilaginibacter phyllosphaerae]MBB3970961.1 nucleotide-binding universal stress UspA family protein [Mucilaginibacter phyllosphaerae]TEW64107.1 universal stress protein [Mucilaginibacter phyllosphaerae]GGH05743.1 hypothetical protein GCM10007352_09610 [Mucilaginibacter phyllosphaerae]
MKTYLVPVDFSDAALNAADFAARLSHQTDVATIVLMNAYYISPYETLLPNPDMVMLREEEIEEEATERLNRLKNLKAELSKQVRDGVTIKTRLNRSHLLRAVVDVVALEEIDMVIIGSIGNSTVREGATNKIGDHVIRISKASPAPVLVIPPDYRYRQIREAVIACDFKKVKDNIPMDILHKLLGKQTIRLLVLNIDREGRHNGKDPEMLAQESALHLMLQNYQTRYFYENYADVLTGILDFARDQKAQLLIALPHNYSFLQSLLHTSISQQLAKNSTVPVLLLK